MTLLCDAKTDGSFLVHHFLSFYLKGMNLIDPEEKETQGKNKNKNKPLFQEAMGIVLTSQGFDVWVAKGLFIR